MDNIVNPKVGLIMKTEPEMAGIYRWTNDLLEALGNDYPISRFETTSPNSFFYKNLIYPAGRLFGKDIKTAIRNYPSHFENLIHTTAPKLWHLASQTFARILPTLKAPSIITVFDLYPYIFDVFASNTDRRSYLKTISNIQRADKILTLSNSARDEIVTSLNIPKEKISVIPPGIHPQFKPHNVKRDPYSIIYVGSELPRKNLTRLFESLALVFKEIPEAHFTKIGRPQWPESRKLLETSAKQLGIEKKVKFLDYVDDLPQLYSASGVSVLVSTHEGFGYPVIEAMACGTPTIVSNIPALRELSNGASQLVDPLDSQSIADGIIKVLSSNALSQSLTHKGVQRRQDFTFEKWKINMDTYYNKTLVELG